MRGEDLGKFILRIAIGGLLLMHGIQKLRFGIDWMDAMLTAHNLPVQLKFGAYAGEVLGPVLVILGFLTRPGALLMAGNMGFAIFLAKMDDVAVLKQGAWGIELEALFLLGSLAILFLGAGKISLRKGAARVD